MRKGGGTARIFLTTVLGTLVLGLASVGLAASNTSKTVVVALDGSGNYRTVAEAIAAVPARSSGKQWVIRVKPGTYREKLRVSREHAPITLLGEDAEKTIIVNGDSADDLDPTGARLGVQRCATIRIDADDFTAENITFANDHKPRSMEGEQGLAVYFTGDRGIFRACRILGWNNTLCLEKRRQYLEKCYISGQADFIAGGAEAFFEGCVIHCIASGTSIAAAATPAEQPFGFVFHDCRISAEPGVKPTHLGRPWRPAGSVTWLSTEMTEVVAPQGWAALESLSLEKTARFTEYRSSGPGAKPASRARWSRQLTDDEAQRITVQNVLAGHDGWTPVGAIIAQP